MDVLNIRFAPYKAYINYLKQIAGPMVGIWILVCIFRPDLRPTLFYWVMPASAAIVAFKLITLSRDKAKQNEVRVDQTAISLFKDDQLIRQIPWKDATHATFRTVLGYRFLEVYGPAGCIKFNATYGSCHALEKAIRQHVHTEIIRDQVSMRRSVLITLGILNVIVVGACAFVRPPFIFAFWFFIGLNLMAAFSIFAVRERLR